MTLKKYKTFLTNFFLIIDNSFYYLLITLYLFNNMQMENAVIIVKG